MGRSKNGAFLFTELVLVIAALISRLGFVGAATDPNDCKFFQIFFVFLCCLN